MVYQANHLVHRTIRTCFLQTKSYESISFYCFPFYDLPQTYQIRNIRPIGIFSKVINDKTSPLSFFLRNSRFFLLFSPHTEIVITGRYAPQELINIADLVTNMQEVKHYYSLGVLSRNGIDHWKPRLTAVHTNEIKIFYTIYCLIKNYNLFSHRHSFIHHFVLCWMKKGIRWKSGTIPVAVFPPFKGKVYRTFATG